MRRPDPVHLSPDEHCAVHHFIRVHGRRPTAAELVQELQGTSSRRSATPRPAAALTYAWRREVARLLGRL